MVSFTETANAITYKYNPSNFYPELGNIMRQLYAMRDKDDHAMIEVLCFVIRDELKHAYKCKRLSYAKAREIEDYFWKWVGND